MHGICPHTFGYPIDRLDSPERRGGLGAKPERVDDQDKELICWGIELKRRAGVRAETEENLVFLLDERIRRISREVLEQQLAQERGATDLLIVDQEARRLQQTLQRIMSKEFISAKEAACSSTVQSDTFTISSIEPAARSTIIRSRFARSVKRPVFYAPNFLNGPGVNRALIS